ncbi:MAG: hypothetical protein IK099_10330 [Clostridia bacterium]|nr:hypothetical protein [Clostridia bacterium]
MTRRTRTTTRPRVAAALMEAGIPTRRTVNVFDRDKSAWEYPDTPEARRIVAAAVAAAKKERAAE